MALDSSADEELIEFMNKLDKEFKAMSNSKECDTFIVKEEKIKNKTIAAISFMAGVCTAAAVTIVQGISEIRDVGTAQVAVMGASAITAVVAGVSYVGTVNLEILQRRIGKLLKAQHKHV